ncbi:MAG: MazG family protein [Ruminococcaceae bacterium]|nr:MazG family protein [Oscillospiraceae bacterium]
MTDKAREYLNKERYTVDDLLEIMKFLRIGCPWDREQTHETIRQCFIEEVYEVCDAIDKKDPELMCEELGDVLLQVVFHAQMAEEKGEFTFSDSVDGICRKLVLRHPHVFGETEADTVGKVLNNWDKIKQDSKGQKTVKDTLVDVPMALPALMRAQKIAKRASKGSCYELEKCEKPMDKRMLGEELFKLCSKAQSLGFDAEEALYEYCSSFIEDFQ